jgi:chromosomal replication initiator protein
MSPETRYKLAAVGPAGSWQEFNEQRAEMKRQRQDRAKRIGARLSGEHLPAPNPRTTVELIQATVAADFGVEVHEITGSSRRKTVQLAHQIAMALTRELTLLSFLDIAQAFKRTHAPVISACKTLARRCQADPRIDAKVNRLRRILDEESEAA